MRKMFYSMSIVGKVGLFALGMLCGFAGSATAAAVTTVPYENSFEESAEVSEWQFADVPPNVFNPTLSVKTKWSIGTQTAMSGNQSLYVVNKAGTVGYDAGSYVVCAYRTFILPQGQYDISFDWKAGGSTSDGLYALWVPVSNSISGQQTGATLPVYVGGNEVQNCKQVVSAGVTNSVSFPLRSNSAFSNISGTVFVDAANAATGYNLVFMWLVNNTSATPTSVSAAIDNIYITAKPEAGSCFTMPTALTYAMESGMAKFSWTGNATSYDVQFYSTTSGNTVNVSENTTSNSFQYSLSDMPEGVYTFRVRAVCSDGSSQWAIYPNKLIYDPSSHCLDYLNFNASGVECRYGTWSYPSDVTGSSGTVGVVDYGYASEQSRHTYHYIDGETDERTENMLPTKPVGAVASVRLGNWDDGAEWESITYTTTLGEDVGVLLLKYALVLQDPSHSANEQPRFTLEILHADGTPVDAICGAADFRAGINTEGWHTIGTGYNKVLWKEWTTVGLNVRELEGQTIKIRLTTYDCSQGAHYGYAYFTLDCSSGEMKGVTCGEKPRELTVDEGFTYRWYKPNNPSEPFYEGQDPTSRQLYIAASDSNYYSCDLISLTNSSCYFTLSASAQARFPKARAELRCVSENCENYLEITNKSGVFGYYTSPFSGREVETFMEDCNSHEWSLVDEAGVATVFSNEKAPSRVLLSRDGGTVHLRLAVTMRGETCSDVQDFYIDAPAIGPSSAETTAYLCEGGSIEFEGKTYTEAGTYNVLLNTWAGCDSLLTLHLEVLKADTVRDTVVICGGETYEWQGHSITTEGEYDYHIPYQTRVEDCDSIVWLRYVEVLDNLKVTLLDAPTVICGDDKILPITVHIDQGMAGFCSLLFDDTGHSGGFKDILEVPVDSKRQDLTIDIPISTEGGAYKRPNHYKANLVMNDLNKCSDVDMFIEFDVLYPDSILLQLWDDVLSVTNSAWNGGYEFTAYQWYKDGEMLPGETQFRLYLPEEKLSLDAEYSVLLTRADDGVSIMTCGFRPHSISDKERDSIVLVFYATDGQAMQMQTSRRANVQVYSPLGVLVASTQIDGWGEIVLPSRNGLYVVSVTDMQGNKETFRALLR